MSDVEFVAADADASSRLDAAVAAHAGVSRSVAARLIDAGSVLVDGRPRARSFRLGAGMRVSVTGIALEEPVAPAPEDDVDVPVRYEDEWLLVLAKPAGLVVHPAPGHPAGTLVNALLARAGRPAGGEIMRPGIVHRLDAGTSGLMIVAKDEAAFERLSEMMSSHDVERTYLALVEGSPSTEAGTIDAPLGRSARHRKKIAVVAGGRDAITDYRVVERFDTTAALVEAKPRTGRTHQIRVHMAAAGHAVIGDAVYGRDRKLARRLFLDRPFLHSAAIRFTHPMTDAIVEMSEPLPADLESALSVLRSLRA